MCVAAANRNYVALNPKNVLCFVCVFFLICYFCHLKSVACLCFYFIFFSENFLRDFSKISDNCFTEPWLWDFGLAFWRAALFDSIQPNDDNVRRQPERNWMKLVFIPDVRRPYAVQPKPTSADTDTDADVSVQYALSRVDLFQVGISDFVFRIHFGLLRGDDARALK